MFVSCYVCQYDSGDRGSSEVLATKVQDDGGTMQRIPPSGTREIICPNGHGGDNIHLD